MSADPPMLLDAVMDDDEEITAKHAPDLSLFHQGTPPRAEASGIARVKEPSLRPPPPPHRAKIRLLPIERLRQLLDRYAECAGPAARPILLNEISKLQASPDAFPLLFREQLVAGLAARLDDPLTRRSFVEDARRILEEGAHV